MSAVVSLLHSVWGQYKNNSSYVNRARYRTMVRAMPALRVPTNFGMVPAPGASPWEDWFDYLSSYDVFQDGRKLPKMPMVDYFVCAFDWLGDHSRKRKLFLQGRRRRSGSGCGSVSAWHRLVLRIVALCGVVWWRCRRNIGRRAGSQSPKTPPLFFG